MDVKYCGYWHTKESSSHQCTCCFLLGSHLSNCQQFLHWLCKYNEEKHYLVMVHHLGSLVNKLGKKWKQPHPFLEAAQPQAPHLQYLLQKNVTWACSHWHRKYKKAQTEVYNSCVVHTAY